MATAIDPKRQGRFTLHIPEHLLTEATASNDGYSILKINHKPDKPPDGSRRSVKIRSTGKDTSSLTITDNDRDGMRRSYRYSGSRRKPKKTFIIAFDPTDQSCTLERLTNSFAFNLHTSPDEPSAETLKKKYPQVQDRSDTSGGEEPEGNDDLFGEASDGEPDASNPFDYRHFLNRENGKSSARSRSVSPNPIATPLLNPEKPKAVVRERAVSTPNPPIGKAKKIQKEEATPATKRPPPPMIRMDRRASTRETDELAMLTKSNKAERDESNSLQVPQHISPTTKTSSLSGSAKTIHEEDEDEDDDGFDYHRAGGLEIDFGDEQPQRKRAVTWTGSFKSGGGPISLRSAANSPSSQIQTPTHRSSGKGDEDDEFDLGTLGEADEYDDDDESPTKKYSSLRKSRARQNSEDVDEDVEPISLGPPAHEQKKQVDSAPAIKEDTDSEDDLEAEMLQVFADDEADPAPVQENESSESEAE